MDAEIVEMFWNPLNPTSSSARAMAWHHRQEDLDAHVADLNWFKLIEIGTFLHKTTNIVIYTYYIP